MGVSSSPGYSNGGCASEDDVSFNALEVIVKREPIGRRENARKGNTNWTQGVKSLANTAIEKVREGQESSIWGGGTGDGGSSLPAREDGKSFVLTGFTSGGEYLMGKKGLKSGLDKNSRSILVAKKEVDSSGSVIVKLGSTEGSQVDASPQVQIQKDSLQDWNIRIELKKKVKGS